MSKTTTITGLTNDTEYFVRVFPRNNDEYYQTEPTAVGSAIPIFFSLPVYTGSHAIFGDETKGYIELYSSGALTLTPFLYDFFAVGGGGTGQSEGYKGSAGAGGGGGYVANMFNHEILNSETIPVLIASGKGTTTVGDFLTANGGSDGASNDGGKGGSGGGAGGNGSNTRRSNGGAGGSDGSDGADESRGVNVGGLGSRNTTKPFGGDVAPFNTRPLAGGGAGGGGHCAGIGDSEAGDANGGVGGIIGGGRGATQGVKYAQAGTANTGGGGGGGSSGYGSSYRSGKPGGSGIVIIRWGDWSVGSEDLEEVVA